MALVWSKEDLARMNQRRLTFTGAQSGQLRMALARTQMGN